MIETTTITNFHFTSVKLAEMLLMCVSANKILRHVYGDVH